MNTLKAECKLKESGLDEKIAGAIVFLVDDVQKGLAKKGEISRLEENLSKNIQAVDDNSKSRMEEINSNIKLMRSAVFIAIGVLSVLLTFGLLTGGIVFQGVLP